MHIYILFFISKYYVYEIICVDLYIYSVANTLTNFYDEDKTNEYKQNFVTIYV